MGQSSSTSLPQSIPTASPGPNSDRREQTLYTTGHRRSTSKTKTSIRPTSDTETDDETLHPDYTYDLPDECLVTIFQTLNSGDRKSCSLVCRRWLTLEAQSRLRLSLFAQSDLINSIPKIFDRFDSVTKLTLKCDRRSVSISDEGLTLISLRCRSLTRLKLRACREITDDGIAAFASNCRGLTKLSCGSCTFGAKGMNAVLDFCAGLEELSVKRLRGIVDRNSTEPIGPGAAAASLRVICLKELYNGQCFGPLITGSKSLKTLKLYRCSGDWDVLLMSVSQQHRPISTITEIHLERLQVSDVGLEAIASCPNLDILHLVKTPECTNFGLSTLSGKCKLIRKLHIDGWKANRIGDEGLMAVGKHCPNLQELVLIGVNPTKLSLDMLASNCQNLERLALCGCETVGDPEISCIAEKCTALRKLCIKNCPVSDKGMEALAIGCPNLVKIKVKKCRAVTLEGADRLRLSKGSLAVNFDMVESELLADGNDASASDGAQEYGGGVGDHQPQVNGLNIDDGNGNNNASGVTLSSSSRGAGRSGSFKSRLSLLSGRNFMACTLRRWSSTNSRNNGNGGNS